MIKEDDDVLWAAAVATAEWWAGRLTKLVPVPDPDPGHVKEFVALVASDVAHSLWTKDECEMSEDTPVLALARAEAGFDPCISVAEGSTVTDAECVAVRDGTTPGPVVVWNVPGWTPGGLCELVWAHRAGLTSAVRCGRPWGHPGRCGVWRKVTLCSVCGRDAVECWSEREEGCPGGRPLPAGVPWAWEGWRG